MEKKQILVIFTGAMELGGVERSLLGLLESINYEEYDVDLFLYGHHGPLFPLIDKRVNVLPEVKELAYLRESFITKISHGCYYSALLRLRDAIKAFFYTIDHDRTWAEIMRKCAPELKKHYDLAISFFLPFDFIKEKVDSDYKVGWVHTDYTSERINREALMQEYEEMELIAAVSEQCKNTFIDIFPQFGNKTIVIENALSERFIQEQAEKKSARDEMADDGNIRLLSVGRFAYAKNFDNVPFVCKKLRELGLNVKWYLIGYGGDEALIRQKIAEAKMDKYVIILGKKENPYPYIKECDLYVQPSRYEGKCVAVREAQILNKPVIITNYATAVSQVKDGYDGVIVPMDNDECAMGIARVICDKELQQNLISATKKVDYSNADEIQKLYSLMKK